MTTESTRAVPTRAPWYRRALPSALALFLGLVTVSFAVDPGGVLASDVGGKVATLEAMDRCDCWSLDLGYWAEDLDPDGSLYPMYDTYQAGEQWINATTFPMIYAAKPLYELGGARAAGLLPIAGAVLAALAARALARRLDGDDVLAFWLVGAASPVTVYAMDFWEHAPALGLMLWAAVFSLDTSRPDGTWRQGLAAGLLFGAAASMRQEALLYGGIAGLAVGVRLLSRQMLVHSIGRGAAMAAGAVSMIAANAALENWALGTFTRGSRATGTAAAGGGDAVLRLEEAIITAASPFAQGNLPNLGLAVLLGTSIFVIGRRADDAEAVRPLAVAVGAVALLWGWDTLRDGLGFVPGLAATTPLAVLALGRMGRSADHRFLLALAVLPAPLVWTFGFTGGAGPQWGGRYLLLTGAILLVASVSLFDTSPQARRVFQRFVVASAVITLAGLAFASVRTNMNAQALRIIDERSDGVVVFHNPHRPREAGAFIFDKQWFAAPTEDERAEVAALLLAEGHEQVSWVGGHEDGEPPVVPGWTPVQTNLVFLMNDLAVPLTRYEPS